MEKPLAMIPHTIPLCRWKNSALALAGYVGDFSSPTVSLANIKLRHRPLSMITAWHATFFSQCSMSLLPARPSAFVQQVVSSLHGTKVSSSGHIAASPSKVYSRIHKTAPLGSKLCVRLSWTGPAPTDTVQLRLRGSWRCANLFSTTFITASILSTAASVVAATTAFFLSETCSKLVTKKLLER